MPEQTIAFQGAPGAYSDLACRRVFPEMVTLPCAQFEDAFAAVRDCRARLAMIPIENSVAGRVADIHHLMPDAELHIIGEHFERVNHHLLAVPGATIDTLRTVRSHVHALSQCRLLIRLLGLVPQVAADTAGAAAEIAARGDPSRRVISSSVTAPWCPMCSNTLRASGSMMPVYVIDSMTTSERSPCSRSFSLVLKPPITLLTTISVATPSMTLMMQARAR